MFLVKVFLEANNKEVEEEAEVPATEAPTYE
jgi:hypothetical protein